MKHKQHLFLARVVVDGSRRRAAYSQDFEDLLESLIALARRDRAYDAISLLESERVRLQEEERNFKQKEKHGVKRFLTENGSSRVSSTD